MSEKHNICYADGGGAQAFQVINYNITINVSGEDNNETIINKILSIIRPKPKELTVDQAIDPKNWQREKFKTALLEALNEG